MPTNSRPVPAPDETLREFSAVKPETARPRILHAAVRCCAERGIDATTVREIAQAAGVTDAAIFRYWPTKDALIEEALRLSLESMQREFQEADDPAAATDERLRRIVEVMMRRAHEKPASWRFVRIALDEQWSGRPPHQQFNGPLQTILGEGMDRGEVRRQPLWLAAGMAGGAIRRGITIVTADETEITDEQGIDLIARAVWNMVKA
jgi:AcrR family transcriptional regulator